MNIYPLTQVRPYVYMGIHKVTGEFYIGYREANTKPSHIDLFEYRTSSKIVKPNFDNYDWLIIAEFEIGNDAYDFEQQMIFNNWSDPLLLNGQYRLPNGKKRFKGNSIQSASHQEKKSKSMIGKNTGKITWNKGLKLDPLSDSHRSNISSSLKGKSTGPFTEERCKNISNGRKGMPAHNKGKPSLNKGVPQEKVVCPHCSKEGGVTGMKRYHFNNCSAK